MITKIQSKVLFTIIVVASILISACAPIAPGGYSAPAAGREGRGGGNESAAPAEEAAAAPAAESDASITIWADDLLTPILLNLGEQFQSEYGVSLVVESVADRYDQFPVAAPAGAEKPPAPELQSMDAIWRSLWAAVNGKRPKFVPPQVAG